MGFFLPFNWKSALHFGQSKSIEGVLCFSLLSSSELQFAR
jgi:hypothetical protein